MRVGARELLDRFNGSRLAVAEALLNGQIRPIEEEFVADLLDPVLLTAVKLRHQKRLRAPMTVETLSITTNEPKRIEGNQS